ILCITSVQNILFQYFLMIDFLSLLIFMKTISIYKKARNDDRALSIISECCSGKVDLRNSASCSQKEEFPHLSRRSHIGRDTPHQRRVFHAT
ncbi:hypothetical protein, partial [Pantoea stewartii]|uniref:hypothetical protein n=1 Tax=Pantoea stewartii TaxID=66269 RepID=UPI0019D33E77